MNPVEFAVHRRVSTAMVYVLVAVLGIVAIYKIPLEFMPKIEAPFVDIHIPYEGASPVEVCEQIVEPIEEVVATLPGIKNMRSRCRTGYAYIGIELLNSDRMDYMVLDIQERIDQIRGDLPADVRSIWINKFDTEQFPVLFGALLFPKDQRPNNEMVERLIVRPLKTIEGVASVQLDGLEQRRVLVEIDENRLTTYGVNILQVFDVLITANLNTSAGTIDFKDLKHSVRIVGEFQDLKEIGDLPVTGKVKISDVADVRIDYVKPFFIGRLDRQRVYILSVLKESGANTVEVCREVNRRLAEIPTHRDLKNVKMKIWFDQSLEITTSMDILTDSGIVGAILAFLIMVAFLKNLRSTFIVSLSIPLSMLTTCAIMYFLDLSFNVITMSALILAVGMLVDNSIVVLEAIDIRHRRGESPLHAALHGAKEVGLAITVASSTTVIVFLPLIFSENSAASTLMKQLGIVLAIAIGSSLAVSLTIIPLFSAQLFAQKAPELPRWYAAFSNWFTNLLVYSLKRRGKTLGIIFGLFVVSCVIFAWPKPRLIEKEAIPAALMRAVNINLKFERKLTLDEVDQKLTELEDIFMAKKEEWDLDAVTSFAAENMARLFLILPDKRMPKYTARQIRDWTDQLIAEKIKWPGITLDTTGGEMHGPPGSSNSTSIKIRGPDPEQVYKFAEDVRKRLQDLPGLKEIKPIERTTEDELHIMVDRDLARQYGFQTNQVSMAVSYAIRGTPVGQMHHLEEPLDIYIQVRDADKKNIAQLESMAIQNLSSQYVPLRNISNFKLVPIPNMVRRDDRLITARIPIVAEGRDLGLVRANISARLQNYRLPMGYSWVAGEEFEERDESLKTLLQALILAMILVFLVMTAQFESFFLPFVIMFELPFAMIGVVIALLISRATFSVLSGAGCLILIGIVVNNAIVLVDHVHQLRQQGVGEIDSLIQGSRDRLRPIMMTALTTIGGLIPMAMGFNDTGKMMYSPLAVTVLGGLAASTFLTPFAIPLIYSLSDDVVRWLKSTWAQATQN